MAFINKLDTNIVTISPDPLNPGQFQYTTSPGTIELANVQAYYTYIDLQGTPTTYTYIALQAGSSFIIDETYAAIDALINP